MPSRSSDRCVTTAILATILCAAWPSPLPGADRTEANARSAADAGLRAAGKAGDGPVADYRPAGVVLGESALGQAADELFGRPGSAAEREEWLPQSCDSLPYLVEQTAGGEPLFRNGRPLYNRLRWWDKSGDRLRLPSGPATPGMSFECIFNRPITSIVGGNLASFAGRGFDPRHLVDWGESGAALRMQFAARAGAGSEPRLERRKVTVDGEPGGPEGVERVVLVNRGQPLSRPIDYATAHTRPSLWLDFYLPQRAVGLEFGLVDLSAEGVSRPGLGPGVGPDTEGVRLIAYGEDGKPLTYRDADGVFQSLESDANQLQGGRLQPDRVSHRIGLVDQQARIRSVELRFGAFEPNRLERGRIVEPQMIYRVWHEALPVAAVLEGEVSAAYGPGEPAEPPLETKQLPFRCDRAAALLRGFRLRRDDGEQQVRRLAVRLVAEPVEDPPGLRVGVVGDLSRDGTTAGEVGASYTIVAWDSTQTDLYLNSGAADGAWASSPTRSEIELPERRAAPFEAQVPLAEGFRIDVLDVEPWSALSPGRWWMAIGRSGGSADGGWTFRDPVVGPASSVFSPVSIDRGADGSLVWRAAAGTHASGLLGDILPVALGFGGSVLGGESVRFAVPRGFVTQTEHGTLEIDPAVVRAGDVSPRLETEVAFVGLESFRVEAGGGFTEVEVAVSGAVHDGSTVDWGASGRVVSEDGDAGLFAVPLFGGVVRRAVFEDLRIDVRDASCDGGVVGLVSACDGIGAVRNGDRRPLAIRGLALVGEAAARFEPRLLWRGSLYAAGAVEGAGIVLDPGEELLIGGSYRPEGPAGEAATPLDSARLLVRTADPRRPVVRLAITGRARAAASACSWLPDHLDFGAAAVAPATLGATLLSSGETPLVLRRLRLAAPSSLFRFHLGQRLEGEAQGVRVEWRGSEAASRRLFENALVAETDAGECSLPLAAGGFRPR